MAWKPNIVTRQAIQGFISDLFSTAPEIMGIDEAISACEVILMDPYATGTLPRYIRVRIREFYQDVMWRGSPSLVVGDFCTVLHFRDGNRYEVIGASGAGGIDLAEPYLYVWVYDVSLGILVPYDTINGALGYGPLAAGDFVLIPPGTFDETITLVNGVFICEQIPGTVTITYTGAPNALSGTVVVADGGYLNVRNIYRIVDGDCNAVFAGAAFSAECTIIVENIDADGAAGGNFIRGVRMHLAPGTLHLYAKTITATSDAVGGWTGYAVQCWYGNGTINLYVEQGYGTGPTSGYGVNCGGNLADGSFTMNVYGGEWEGAGATDAGIFCTSYGTIMALHARAIGSVQDIHITGTGVVNIFQVQYDTVTVAGTLAHLPGDHIVLDLDTDTYITALAADDRIDLFVAGANPTDFKFGASNVITILDNIAQAWSIADAGGLEYMRIVSTNANPLFLINPAGTGVKVGIGTATVPHGAVGWCKIAIDGTTTSMAGPHVQVTTSADDYPVFQQLNWSHDVIEMMFDAYYDGAYKSSDLGSNCNIRKRADQLDFLYDSGVAQGGAVAWNSGIVMDLTNGAITVGGPSMTVPAAWNLIVPDNIADAFGIDDVGGLEYMRIVSTNAQPVTVFNSGEVDINFRVAGAGVTNTLYVDATTSRIGLGCVPQAQLNLDSGGDASAEIRIDANRALADRVLGGLDAYWNTNQVAAVYLVTGSDAGNQDEGEIHWYTATDNGVFAKRMSLHRAGYLRFHFATETLRIDDAGSAGATAQDWIAVEVGGNTGYIRVYNLP